MNTKEISDYDTFMNKTKNKEISSRRLGWFAINSMKITVTPKIQIIEKCLKQALEEPVDKIIKLE